MRPLPFLFVDRYSLRSRVLKMDAYDPQDIPLDLYDRRYAVLPLQCGIVRTLYRINLL